MRDSLRIFEWVHYDPGALLAGAHQLLIRNGWVSLIQLVLTVAGSILMMELSNSMTHYSRVCCYPGQSPSAAEYANGGSCADVDSVAHQYGDMQMCDSAPISHVLLGVFGGAAFLGALLLYVLTYKPYMRQIRGHVKYYLHAAGFSTVAEEIEADSDENGGHTLFAMSHYVMLFPVVGILFGMHEKAIGRLGLYYARLIMMLVGVLFFFLMDAMLAWNGAWGCYPEFSRGIGDIDRLFYGRCDDYRSVAYSWDGGRVGNWVMSDVFMAVFGVCALGWLGIYCLRWTGLRTRAGRVLVSSFSDSFIATLSS